MKLAECGKHVEHPSFSCNVCDEKQNALKQKGRDDRRKRDEALWTEYAKAALSGLMKYTAGPNNTAELSNIYADAMLTAHNKRWPRE